jgi:hypothetical protein
MSGTGQFHAAERLLCAIAALLVPLGLSAHEYPSVVQSNASGCFSYEVVYVPETVPDFAWAESITCSNVAWQFCDVFRDMCILWPSGCEAGLPPGEQCPFVIDGPYLIDLVDGCLSDPASPGTVSIDFAACGGSLLAETLILPFESDCIDNSDCASGEFCQKASGACGEPGQCVPRPVECPQICEPVCGCDQADHDNSCRAFRAGTSVAHVGVCGAKTIRVPEDQPTIQAAIDSALAGDVIDVAPGTYVLPPTHPIDGSWYALALNKAITLKSRELYQAVLDGGGQDTILVLVQAAAHIEGFVVQNAWKGFLQRASPNVTWTARNMIVRNMAMPNGTAFEINDAITRTGSAEISNVVVENCNDAFNTNDADGFTIRNSSVINCNKAFVGHNHNFFEVSYSAYFDVNIRDGVSPGTPPIVLGPGMIDADPQLFDAVADGLPLPYFPMCASPLVDAGDPDVRFNDSGFPPSLGSARNDIGGYGGPSALLVLSPAGEADLLAQAGCAPTPTPTPVGTAAPTLTGTPTPTILSSTPTATATTQPTATGTPTPAGTPTPLPRLCPTPTPTASPPVSPSPTASPTPTASPQPTNGGTPTPTASATPTFTPVATPTAQPTATGTPSPTATPTAAACQCIVKKVITSALVANLHGPDDMKDKPIRVQLQAVGFCPGGGVTDDVSITVTSDGGAVIGSGASQEVFCAVDDGVAADFPAIYTTDDCDGGAPPVDGSTIGEIEIGVSTSSDTGSVDKYIRCQALGTGN